MVFCEELQHSKRNCGKIQKSLAFLEKKDKIELSQGVADTTIRMTGSTPVKLDSSERRTCLPVKFKS